MYTCIEKEICVIILLYHSMSYYIILYIILYQPQRPQRAGRAGRSCRRGLGSSSIA